MKSTHVRSSNEWQWRALKIGYRDNSISNDRQGAIGYKVPFLLTEITSDQRMEK